MLDALCVGRRCRNLRKRVFFSAPGRFRMTLEAWTSSVLGFWYTGWQKTGWLNGWLVMRLCTGPKLKGTSKLTLDPLDTQIRSLPGSDSWSTFFLSGVWNNICTRTRPIERILEPEQQSFPEYIHIPTCYWGLGHLYSSPPLGQKTTSTFQGPAISGPRAWGLPSRGNRECRLRHKKCRDDL